jgi:hypothetical protein
MALAWFRRARLALLVASLQAVPQYFALLCRLRDALEYEATSAPQRMQGFMP